MTVLATFLTRTMCIRLPLPVKAKLAKEAERRGCSLNDLALELLGKHYNVDVTLSGRQCSRSASPSKPIVVLRVPKELHDRVRADAFNRQSNLTHRVTEVLSAALGVPVAMGSPKRTVPFGGAPRRAA